jgi:hypothetical protein
MEQCTDLRTGAAMVIPLSSGAAFAGLVMASVAYTALPVPRLACMEVVERLRAGIGPA